MEITETLAATVPRVENRQAYNIAENTLPFVDYDV